MSDPIFDFSELNKLAADIGDIPAKLTPNVTAAVKVSALLAKTEWRQIARSRVKAGHAKRYPFSIDYDMKASENSIGAEIGPNLGSPQGALGILEEANGGVRAAPQRNIDQVLKKVIPDFAKGIEIAVGKSMKL